MDEIKRDRDFRINKIRKELDDTNNSLDELRQAHSSLTIKHSHLEEQFKELGETNDLLSKNLTIANNGRQVAEDALKRMTLDNEILNQKLSN